MLDFCNLFSGTGTIGKKTNKNPQKPNPPTSGLQTLSLKVNTLKHSMVSSQFGKPEMIL